MTAESDSDVITWWSTNRASSFGVPMEELPVFEALQERTKTKITFVHPPAGQYDLRFKMMVASGKLPEIISHDFLNNYPGGIGRAVEDGIILPLDADLIDSAPYLKAYLDAHPEVAADIRLGDGSYACFPSFNADEFTSTYMGPFIRQDLLDKEGLDIPETLAEWEEVLGAFSSNPAIDIPLTFYGGNIRDTRFLVGTFGLDWSFLRKKGRIIYGPAEPEFVSFVRLFREWYQRGWMNPGVLVNSSRAYARTVERTTAGIYVDYVSNILRYEKMLQKRDPAARLVPLSYPKLDESAPVPPGHDSGRFIPFAAAYVTTSAKDPDALIKMLDYLWSPEGYRLCNFGIEGQSYDLVEDRPVLRSGLFETEGIGGYKYYLVSGPYLKDKEAFMQSLRLPSQKEAVSLWSSGLSEENRPTLFPPSGGDEADRLLSLKTTLDAYAFETVLDVISGKAGDDRLEGLREELLGLGLAEALRLYNAPANSPDPEHQR